MLISMQIDEQELIAALSRLDDNIKSGPDGIPPYFIKRLKFPLLSPLLKLYNKSLSSGVFPDFWKESFIFPIHKDGDKSDVVNYRPISILSTFAKIFESIIAKRLAEYFLRSIGSFQHGSIKGRSTLTNLLLFNNFIFEAFLEKWQVDSIYIDFSKAFDRVNHGMLLRKLENAGIGGSLLKWLESYLSCRSQSVRSCGASSFKFSPTSGVPQGSNLGPLLFSVFINDLAEVVKLVKVLLYADDIKLLFLVRSERDAVTLQRELEGLLRWSVSNGLPINLSKCKVISFCVGECPFSTHYKLGNIELERVDQIRDLGVIMDKSLSFREQSQVVIKKCLRIFGFIRNVTIDFNNLFTISYLYKILLLPIITYCIPIWYPKTENSLKELIAIEHKFLRYASTKTSSPMHFFEHDYTQIRNKLGLQSLRSLIKEIDYITAFKIAKKVFNSPEVNSLFRRRTNSHNLRNIREMKQKKAPNFIDNSATFRLTRIWNHLPLQVRQLETLTEFKKEIKRFC